jgi:peptidyl-Lys metalloendopeptidase
MLHWAFVGTALNVSGVAVAAEEPACAGAELQLANKAAGQAKAMLDKAIAAIDNPSPTDLDRLRLWLGVVNSNDAQKVKQVLVSSRAFNDGISFRCAVNTNVGIGDVYAYVYPDKSFAIVLGAFFFKASDTGYNSRPGVLVHEMTHFTLAGATKDAVYGVEGAKQLAAQNPAAAQRTADNYEYFVESIAFGLN